MSIPSCIRPQRQPNGLVTGPLTGQMKPDADGVVSPGAYEYADWADRMREASAALAACSPAASCRYSAFASFTLLSALRLATRAAASRLSLARSWSCRLRTWFVRTAI